MTDTTAAPITRIWRATVGDLIDLALAQPHQVLLSTGSVAIMAQFAAHGGIVDPLIGYLIAGGVEWAYLRGLASNAKAPTGWATTLNWSAFGIVVIWGVLWVADLYGAFSVADVRGSAWAWLLAVLHIVPVAWLSLCAAMTHSAAATLESRQHAHEARAARERERERQRVADEVEAERLRRELAIDLEVREAEQQALARARVRAAQTPHGDPAQSPHGASARQIPRDELVRRVRAVYEADSQFSRAAMARETGWSEAMIRKVLKEIQEG